MFCVDPVFAWTTPVTVSETAAIRASRMRMRFPVIRDRRERPVVPLITSLLKVERAQSEGGKMIAPIEEHDVCRIEYPEESNAIDDLLRQHEVEVFTSRFDLRQRGPHPERHNAYWMTELQDRDRFEETTNLGRKTQ